jgi:hypothetical protein
MQIPSTKDSFVRELTQKCVDMNAVIHSTLTPYIHLMGLEYRQILTRQEVDYLPALWAFFTRIIYERPCLLLVDSAEGDNVSYIQESFQWFISEQVKTIPSKKTEDPT